MNIGVDGATKLEKYAYLESLCQGNLSVEMCSHEIFLKHALQQRQQ